MPNLPLNNSIKDIKNSDLADTTTPKGKNFSKKNKIRILDAETEHINSVDRGSRATVL